ncbi:MAG: alpha/beta fold hydrolase [Burkholderiaceae bacterium]
MSAPSAPPPPSNPAASPARSALARLQRRLMALGTLVSAAWLALAWPYSPTMATWGLFLGAWSHALVLALEFALAAWVNRTDPVPHPTMGQRLSAWWQEATFTPAIFLWRQPFRWRDWPDDPPPSDEVFAGGAVVLIHGFVCNRGFWAPWMQALRRAGIPYASVNLEPVFGSIDAGIPLIEAAVSRAEKLGRCPPVLVCHSMGGLAARAWLASAPGNLERVGRVITIGSPHHGTWLARWSRVTNGRQMRQSSGWLNELASRERALHGWAAYKSFICFHSHADHIVYPISSALLPGADNRHVPGAPHVALAFHPRVIRESLATVAPGAISSEARTAS